MIPFNNVCPVKIRSKHSSNTLLCLLRIFTGQTLIGQKVAFKKNLQILEAYELQLWYAKIIHHLSRISSSTISNPGFLFQFNCENKESKSGRVSSTLLGWLGKYISRYVYVVKIGYDSKSCVLKNTLISMTQITSHSFARFPHFHYYDHNGVKSCLK